MPELLLWLDGSDRASKGDPLLYKVIRPYSRGSSQICDNFPARAKNCDDQAEVLEEIPESDRLDEGAFKAFQRYQIDKNVLARRKSFSLAIPLTAGLQRV